MAYAVLLVEDDFELARNVCDFLELKGYLADHAANVAEATHRLASDTYDLLILDIALPGGDGVSLCRHVRQEMRLNLPIVMLTAKDDLDSKVDAFDFGADDYIVKPAALREIEARIRALIRRARRETDPQHLAVGDLRFDPGSLRVERAGVTITLPPVPLKILRLLMTHAPNVVLRTTIQKEIWGDEPQDPHALIVHMHTLRNAVDRPFDRQMIQTVRGFGYRIAHADD